METSTLEWMVVVAIVVTVGVLISAGTATFLRRPPRARITKSSTLWVPPTWIEVQTGRLNGPNAEVGHLALSNLEAHAQANPEQRAPITAILCEHLRRESSDAHSHLARAVQRVLTSHARAGSAEHWSNLDLDLDRARLEDLDLSHANVRRLSLVSASLTGSTRLTAMRCEESLRASGALFDGPVEAERLAIHGDTQLSGAVFTSRCSFAGGVFHGDVEMPGAVFSGPAWFTGVVFLGVVTLSSAYGSASFDGPVDLQRAAGGVLRLDGNEFPAGVTLGGADEVAGPRVVAGHNAELVQLVRNALHHVVSGGSLHGTSSEDGRSPLDGDQQSQRSGRNPRRC